MQARDRVILNFLVIGLHSVHYSAMPLWAKKNKKSSPPRRLSANDLGTNSNLILGAQLGRDAS
jgi:hypothetical protein